MMRRVAVLASAMLACVCLSAAPARAGSVPEPDSYRMDEYRAPVPATLRGARVISTDEAAELWRGGAALFVDVLPKPPKPALPEGTVWNEKPHFDIPGSLWLPDVGYGVLSPEMQAWFGDSLAAATGGDRSRAMVIYCRADCWMSWNAARRAVAWGYGAILWYPHGTDGWEAAKLPLEERTPEPRPDEVR